MTDARQWVQPLFMVYSLDTDEMVPLTQERLDMFVAIERQYGQMIMGIRDSHASFASVRGWKAAPFAGFGDK